MTGPQHPGCPRLHMKRGGSQAAFHLTHGGDLKALGDTSPVAAYHVVDSSFVTCCLRVPEVFLLHLSFCKEFHPFLEPFVPVFIFV